MDIFNLILDYSGIHPRVRLSGYIAASYSFHDLLVQTATESFVFLNVKLLFLVNNC